MVTINCDIGVGVVTGLVIIDQLGAFGFAEFANRLGSLIEAVNKLGSLFYGTILAIFLLAFYMKKVGGRPPSSAP